MLERDKAVGQQLGNYRLTRLLGSGGFADVYLGEHIHLATPAAIKVLRTKMTGDEMASFLQEARTIVRLVHPHIIRVLDFNVENMTPFLVMEYLPGGTLRQKHPKGTQVPLPTIVEYIKQIASALNYAHDRKFVHRDVKPENMLIDEQGNIVLSDFGVASNVHSTESQTVVELAGTITYIAPEQLHGLPRPASDQYALGVVAYEWLSGERPFQGSFAEVASQHLIKPPPTLHGRIPGVSVALEQVLFKALAKEPHDRFASVQDFAVAFERAAQQGTYDPFSTAPFLDNNPAISAHSDSRLTAVPTLKNNSAGQFSPPPPPPPPLSPSSSQPSYPRAGRAKTFGDLKPQWKVTAIVVPLLLLLTIVSILYTTTNAASGNRNTGGAPTQNTPIARLTATAQTQQQNTIATAQATSATAGAATQATTTAQATQATATAQTAQATATTQAVQATATSQADAANSATATAIASTPGGLYQQITASQPTISGPLAGPGTERWDQNAACVFNNGAYQVIDSQPNTFSVCLAQATNFCNFAYQVQVSIASGDGAGLIFRDTAANQDRLRFGSDGTYDLVNAKSTLTGGSSAALNKGANATNTVTVITRGSAINLYFNGQYVTSVNETSTNCGNIGLMAVNFGNSANVTYSNLKVWKL